MLSLTGGSFDKALLSKARIFAKEARWSETREMVKAYSKKNKADTDAGDLVSIWIWFGCGLSFILGSCSPYRKQKWR